MATANMERRIAPRVSASFPISLGRSAPDEALAMCHNVSPGGICVGCALGLAVGERVTLTFRVSQSDPVDHVVPGRVVWVRRNLDSHIGLWRYLAAIAFDEPQRWISIFSRS